MLLRENYTKEHIARLREQTGADPSILERTIFAVGLLEAIRSVGMPFIFKGGTSLLVLLDHPRRLSTDIDIIVDKGTDVDDYIKKAGTIFPFLSVEEHKRRGMNDIEKRHFRFHFLSRIIHISGLRNDRSTADFYFMKGMTSWFSFLIKTVFLAIS